MNNIKASLIIPTLNRKQVLFNTLESLKGQSVEGFEILIVDQNNKPLELDDVALKDKINHIHLEKKSLPNARNVGVEKARAEVLIYIDDDVEIASKKFIEAHLRSYDNEEIGLVAGRVVQSYEEEKEPVDQVGRITKNLLIVGGSFNSDKKQLTTGIIGCNFSCRKKIWRQVGGFDLGFAGTANLEESDFALSAQEEGWKVMFEPEAELEHFAKPTGGVRSAAQETIKKRYWVFYNYIYLFEKHGNSFLWPLFLSYLITRGFYYFLKDKNPKIIYKSCIKGILNSFLRKENGN